MRSRHLRMSHSGILYHEFAIAAHHRVRAPLPPRFLVEDGVAADVDATCSWDIYPICFGSRLITDENHGSAAIIELLRVWTGGLDMDHAPEGPQVMYRRCGAIPQLVWRSPVGASPRRPVEDVDCRVGGLPPERAWKSTCFEHAPSHPDDGLVLPLSDAILLWRVRCRELANNSKFRAVCREFRRSELSPAIGTQSEKFLSAPTLGCYLDSLDGSRGSVFGVEQCYPHVHAEVIDEE